MHKELMPEYRGTHLGSSRSCLHHP